LIPLYTGRSSFILRHGAYMADPAVASYNATKAALVHWGSTARIELAPLGYVITPPPPRNGTTTSRTNKSTVCE
jgi:short-subunit dehydrogenase